MSDSIKSALAALQADYAEACAERDAVNAQNAPIEVELEKANAECEAARVRALALAEQIDDNRGREAWLELKRKIGRLATAINELKRG